MTATEDTAATMHAIAEELEVSEAKLHASAEASPDEETRRRLHQLGDTVTAEARAIDARADTLLTDQP